MFWFNKLSRTYEFEAKLVKIHVIKTVEEFWSVFQHIKHPMELSKEEEYSFFKNGIPPKWEDPQNLSGGRWNFQSNKYDKEVKMDETDLYLRLVKTNIDYSYLY
uniref:Eukaryotic translation initiation factor 4E-2 (Trinotate prediction) n=1 Tax=Henneguya salminicola TaxID=69463 RepID=A0A6G3MJ08_HENSL